MTNQLFTAQDTYAIRPAVPGSRRRFVGVPVSPPGNPMDRATRDIIASVESFLLASADLDAAPLGPHARGVRRRELTVPALAALEKHGKDIARAKANLLSRMNSASFVKPYDPSTPFYEPLFDLEQAKEFRALQGVDRAKRLFLLQMDCLENFDLVQALLRVRRSLTGLTQREHAELRVATLKTLTPQEHETLEIERQQIALAERAVQEGIAALQDAGASPSDIAEHTPTALALARDGDSLEWLPPMPEGGEGEGGVYIERPVAVSGGPVVN